MLTAEPDNSYSSYIEARRRKLLRFLLGIFCLVCVIFVPVNIHLGDWTLAIIETVIGVVFLAMIFIVNTSKRLYICSWAYTLIGMFWALAASALPSSDYTIFIWNAFIPAFSFFLFGRRTGIILCAFYVPTVIAVIAWRFNSGAVFPVEGLLNLIIFFVLISLMYMYYESTRSHTEQLLIEDIEAKERYALQLKEAKEKVEDAHNSKSRFLANLSHEIRTPLNAICAHIATLNSEIDTPKYSTRLEAVSRGGDALLELFSDVLDISQIESGELSIKRSEVQLLSFAKNIIQLYSIEAESKGIKLELTSGSLIPGSAYIDGMRVRQILSNLITNAIKYTDHGCITVQCLAKEYNTQNKTAILEFSVTDTGVGIAADVQPTIFDDYKRQPGLCDEQYKGTGLGLAICKRLTEKMNGTISLKSEPGKGSAFTVSIPSPEPKRTSVSQDKPTLDLSDFTRSHLECAHLVKEKFAVDALKFQRFIDIDEAKAFIQSVEELAEHYHIESIKRWCRAANENILSLDIVRLTAILNQFDDITSKAEQLIAES